MKTTEKQNKRERNGDPMTGDGLVPVPVQGGVGGAKLLLCHLLKAAASHPRHSSFSQGSRIFQEHRSVPYIWVSSKARVTSGMEIILVLAMLAAW